MVLVTDSHIMVSCSSTKAIKENNILYAKHPLESEATIIANIVSERIIAIINIIKKQNPNLMQPILN